MKKIIIVGLIFFFAAGILKAERSEMSNCTLYDLEGNEVRLSDFKGKPMVLWFWTTWCPYCRKQIPGLNNIYTELKLSGIELIAINVDESKERITRFSKSYPMDFKTTQDKDARCAFSYGIRGVPTYILINRNGGIKFKGNYLPTKKYRESLLN